MIEQVRDAESVEEMKAELDRMRLHCPMVARVFAVASHADLGMDYVYTQLAYHSLKLLKVNQAESLRDKLNRDNARIIIECNGGDVCSRFLKAKDI